MFLGAQQFQSVATERDAGLLELLSQDACSGPFMAPHHQNVQVKGPAWAGWRNEVQEIRCGFIRDR
jgi:hypothetical protein